MNAFFISLWQQYEKKIRLIHWERVFTFISLSFFQTIDGKIFCVHGGIPRAIMKSSSRSILDIIDEIKRPISSKFVLSLEKKHTNISTV